MALRSWAISKRRRNGTEKSRNIKHGEKLWYKIIVMNTLIFRNQRLRKTMSELCLKIVTSLLSICPWCALGRESNSFKVSTGVTSWFNNSFVFGIQKARSLCATWLATSVPVMFAFIGCVYFSGGKISSARNIYLYNLLFGIINNWKIKEHKLQFFVESSSPRSGHLL